MMLPSSVAASRCPPVPQVSGRQIAIHPLSLNTHPTPFYLHCATGLAGVGLGTAVGSLRGHSPLLYALHMGIGYGVFGATFSCTCVLTGRSKYESES